MKRRSQQENMPNLKFGPNVVNKNVKPNKQQQTFSEEFGNVAKKNNLPLKKRFCGTFVEELGNKKKYEDTNNKSRVEKEPKEERNAKILPGVIRHTSCPDSYLAFYFKYD